LFPDEKRNPDRSPTTWRDTVWRYVEPIVMTPEDASPKAMDGEEW